MADQHARIHDGQIQTVLPRVGRLTDGRTVTGYHRLPDDTLAAEGWRPITDDGPPDHDPATQQVSRSLEARDGQVVAIYAIEDIPDPEPTEADRLAAPVVVVVERAVAAAAADLHVDPAVVAVVHAADAEVRDDSPGRPAQTL